MSIATLLVAATVIPGTWGTNFKDALAYAEANNAPIVVDWGNTSCKYCNELSAVLEKPVIMDWAAEHPIVMVLKHDPYQEDERKWTADYKAAREWIDALDESTMNGNPRIGLYWKKADGTVAASLAFTGRDGKMPVTGGSLAEQFAGTLDKYFGEYTGGVTPVPPAPVGDWTTAEFSITGEGIDRLEAEPTTDEMYVPLVRDGGAAAAKGRVRLVVCTPNSSKVSFEQDVEWKAGETAKNVRIDVPTGRSGAKTLVKVLGAGDVTLDETYIWHVAAKENAASNPHWTGEHTASSLPYGEWTLDFDTAKEKVASYGGYLLAMFSGPLWCPHCIGMENSLLSSSKFKTWAKRNKVALVLFDQPVSGQLGPRLLTYDFYYTGSGAAYLSRHGIDPDCADAVKARAYQAALTLKFRTADDIAYEVRPRCGNPTVLLLDRTGTRVAARFNGIESSDKTYDPTENTFRLDELLDLAERDESDDFSVTTTLSLAPGESAAAEFQINAADRFYRLPGFNAAAAKFKATGGKGARDVYLSLVKGNETIVTGLNSLIVDLKATPIDAETFLKVSAYSDAGQVKYASKATAFSVALTAEQGDERLMRTVELDELAKSEALALNANLYAAKTFTVALRTATVGGSTVAGQLSVKQTAKNKLTVKFAGSESKTLSFSGAWEEINLMTGRTTASLASKDGTALSLALDANGQLTADIRLTAGASALGDELTGCAGLPLSSAKDFEGLYTVTLPDVRGEAGTATVSLKVSKAGKGTWSAILPNGAKLSGSAQLSANTDGTASLSLYKRSSSDMFAAEFILKPFAAETWGGEGAKDTVVAPAFIRPCHLYRKGAVSVLMLFEVYGGYWEKNTTPLEICGLFDLSTAIGVSIGGEAVGEVTATKSGFSFAKGGAITSFKYTKATGVFTGAATLDGVKGKISGILLPGWIDCHCGDPVIERPYGSGTFYANGVSLPVDLNAKKE